MKRDFHCPVAGNRQTRWQCVCQTP